MNKAQSIAYFNALGIQIGPSSLKNFQWQLGSGDMHFDTLEDLWGYFKNCWVYNHLSQASQAEQILEVIRKTPGEDRLAMEKWLHNEIREWPAMAGDIQDKAMANRFSMPASWREDYANLIFSLNRETKSDGAQTELTYYYPILGTMIERGMLELLEAGQTMRSPELTWKEANHEICFFENSSERINNNRGAIALLGLLPKDRRDEIMEQAWDQVNHLKKSENVRTDIDRVFARSQDWSRWPEVLEKLSKIRYLNWSEEAVESENRLIVALDKYNAGVLARTLDVDTAPALGKNCGVARL